jgi:hypothetical protein
MASFGPFIYGMLIGWSFAVTGSPNAFFYAAAPVLPVQHRHQLVVLRP